MGKWLTKVATDATAHLIAIAVLALSGAALAYLDFSPVSCLNNLRNLVIGSAIFAILLLILVVYLMRRARYVPRVAWVIAAWPLLSLLSFWTLVCRTSIDFDLLMVFALCANGFLWVLPFGFYFHTKARGMIVRVGLELTEDWASPEEKLSPYEILSKPHFTKVAQDFRTSQVIRILGATGYNTFGQIGQNPAGKKPLLSDVFAVPDPTRHIDIALLNPCGPYVAERAGQVGMHVASYQNEILASIRRCSQLSINYKGRIRCYLYEGPLMWKLIISENYVWQQTYPMHGHVENTPVNVFKRINELTSGNQLYVPFLRAFDLIVARKSTVDLHVEHLHCGDRLELVSLEAHLQTRCGWKSAAQK